MLLMKVAISGTRDGRDWPAIGEPAPSLPPDERASMLAAGLLVESATDDRPVQTATVETRPRARRTPR